jgi:tetratricopeptide (TPR) repeat protein
MAPPPRKPPRARQPKPVEEARRRLTEPKGPKRWGKVARHGAGTLDEDEATASAAWREAMSRAKERDTGPPARDTTEWREDKPKPRKRKQPRTRQQTEDLHLSADVAGDLAKAVHSTRAPRISQRMKEAANAFERERFQDAAKLLKPLSEIAPGVAGVRELYGLTLYRLGRYRDAARELKAYIDLTRDVDQHPVLADCYRALKRWKQVDALWDELRQASPSAELVAEGRIVAAGAQADQGNLPAAIALLEAARADPKRPKDHHLRVWYALADLYERAGDVPKARRLFRRIANHDRDFFDVTDRLRSVG